MNDKEPFLDPALSLQKLANSIGKTPKSLSVLINQSSKAHFFDYVNKYRIDKAKELLGTDFDSKLTVQQVMYQVGFNSKSSFYTAFKKYTNQTPLQYKKAFYKSRVSKK